MKKCLAFLICALLILSASACGSLEVKEDNNSAKSEQNEKVIKGVRELGVPQDVEPFMTTAFMSLAVIPHLKMTTKGLIDVNTQTLVDLVI